jgi:predicted transcriptional regulator
MRTAVTQTTLMSYATLQKEKKLGKLQQLMYDYLLLHPNATDRQMVKELGMTINCCCGRRNELIDMGLVRASGTAYDNETKRVVMTWKTTL